MVAVDLAEGVCRQGEEQRLLDRREAIGRGGGDHWRLVDQEADHDLLGGEKLCVLQIAETQSEVLSAGLGRGQQLDRDVLLGFAGLELQRPREREVVDTRLRGAIHGPELQGHQLSAGLRQGNRNADGLQRSWRIEGGQAEGAKG